MDRNAPYIVLLTIVLGLGLLAAGRDAGRGGDSKPDFTGHWELDVPQSKFGKMPVPTRMTLDESRRGEALHAVQATYNQAGGPDTIEGDWYLDGKERPIGSDGKMFSISRWDGNTLVSERKSHDKSYDEVIRLKLSGDGKTATEEIKLSGPNGGNSSTLIWRRR